jgi:hypothetical protein
LCIRSIQYSFLFYTSSKEEFALSLRGRWGLGLLRNDGTIETLGTTEDGLNAFWSWPWDEPFGARNGV